MIPLSSIEGSIAARPDSVVEEDVAGVLSRAVRSGAWSVVGTIASGVGSFAVSLLVARSLTTGAFGSYSYALWFVRTAATLLAFGLPLAVARHVSDRLGAGDEDGARGYVRTGFVASGLVMPLVFGAGTWMGFAKSGDRGLALLLGACGTTLLLNQIFEGVVSGRRRFDRLARVALVGALAQTGLVVAGVALGFGWRGFLAMQALAFGLQLVLLRSMAGPVLRGGAVAVGDEGRRGFVRYSAILGCQIGADLILWGRPEVFFLEHWRSSEEVGMYSVAIAIVYLTTMVPVLASRAFFPEFSWLRGGGHHGVLAEAFPVLVRYLTFVAVPACIVGAALTRSVISILYGPQFAGASTTAAILVAGAIFGALGGPASAATQTGPRPGVVLRVVAALSLVNLALDWVLVPRHGMVGAAAASITAQAVAVAIVVAYVWRRLGLRYPLRDVAALLASGALGAAVAWPLVHAFGGLGGLVLAGAAGLGTYLAAVSVSGVVTWGELRGVVAHRSPALTEAAHTAAVEATA